VGLKLVHAMNAASAVVADWSYTRQNSNSVTDSYSETILRLGMAFKF